MSDRNLTAELSTVRDAISSTLVRFGFSGPTEAVADGHKFERWTRASDWKREVIEIDYSNKKPDRFNAKALVNAVLGGGVVPLDGVSLPYLSRGATSYELSRSRLLAAARIKRVIADLQGDLTVAIEWLEGYSTPGKCLEQLRRTDRNGCAVGSGVWLRLRDALVALEVVS